MSSGIKKSPEIDGKTIRSSSLTIRGVTGMKTTDEVMTILQFYVMVFILGIESHIPQCHWTHNVLVYFPVCFSAFPYIFLCMYFTDLDDTHRVRARITSRIVDQSFVNAFTFVAIKLGRNEACGSHVRIWNKITAVLLFTGTCLVNYFRLKNLAGIFKANIEPEPSTEPEVELYL